MPPRQGAHASAAAPPHERRELLPRATPAEAFALRGCVLTPDERIDDGYVVVGNGPLIAAVQKSKPDGVRVHDTNGVILPGLIDLHGHPEFNIFAAWEPPMTSVNRYAWRASEIYHQLVRDPQNRLLKQEKLAKTELRYAEIRALVGGVTSIQGTGGAPRLIRTRRSCATSTSGSSAARSGAR
jgi:cytosine/adenosine deaminase-related metal-dependent hydrolase